MDYCTASFLGQLMSELVILFVDSLADFFRFVLFKGGYQRFPYPRAIKTCINDLYILPGTL